MIIFRLSRRSGVPPYLQIVQQVQQAVHMGLLKEGDQLPTVREVVTMITVNPNTVMKAYKELEALKVVEGRAGLGTFVLKQATGPPLALQATYGKKLSQWMHEALQAGLDEESIETLFHVTLRNIRKEHGTHDQKPHNK